MRIRFLTVLLGLLSLLVISCQMPKAVAPAHLALISVSGAQSSRGIGVRSLGTPAWGRGRIDSGPPTEFVFTLKRIMLQGTFDGGGTVAEIWSDAAGKDITVSGTGAVDLAGLGDIHDLPTGTVTGVKIVVAAEAKITGELVDAQFGSIPAGGANVTIPHLYTKAAFAYDSLHQSGGGALADFETGPAEQTSVYWNGGDNLVEQEILTPVSYTLNQGDTPKLTILLDVSRALRFYDGKDTAQGPNPADLHDKAYFFSHSVLSHSIACFFGDPGAIQGYQTIFDVTANVSQPIDIPGWMTLIYDAAGNIQSGILSGDDDNALTVAKGMVTNPVTTSPGNYTFGYDISAANVTGFSKVSTVDSYDDVSWVQPAGSQFAGTARFILKLAL